MLGEDGCTGITLLLRGTPVLPVTGQIQSNLLRLEFGFLQAEEVRVHGGEGFREALFHASPEAIDIPGYKAQVHRPPFRQFFRLCPYHNKKRNRLQPLFQKCYNFPANTSGDGVEQMDRMLWRHINESGNHIFCIKLESCKAQHEV